MTDQHQPTEQPPSQEQEPSYTITLHITSKDGALHMTMGIPEGEDKHTMEKAKIAEESVLRFVEILCSLDASVELTPSRQPLPEHLQPDEPSCILTQKISINNYEKHFGHLVTASTILKRSLKEERAQKPDEQPPASHKVLLFLIDHLDATLLNDFFDTKVRTDFEKTLIIKHRARIPKTLPRIVIQKKVLYEPFLDSQREDEDEKIPRPRIYFDDSLVINLELPQKSSPNEFRRIMKKYFERVLSCVESVPWENEIISWFLEVLITQGIYKALTLLDELPDEDVETSPYGCQFPLFTTA